jgi:ADP-ribosyl-[dinitrogen reductase] hydrolase
MNPSRTCQYRAVGSLLGLAVGDAIGTTLEFRTRDTYPQLTDLIGGGPFDLKLGEWTDDTSMALCLAESLIACGDLDEADLMRRFVRWWRRGENSVNGQCFDIGHTTRSALATFERSSTSLAHGMSSAS